MLGSYLLKETGTYLGRQAYFFNDYISKGWLSDSCKSHSWIIELASDREDYLHLKKTDKK
jgi:hypothetical protein